MRWLGYKNAACRQGNLTSVILYSLSNAEESKHTQNTKAVRLYQLSCKPVIICQNPRSWRLFAFLFQEKCKRNGKMRVLNEERCFIDCVFFSAMASSERAHPPYPESRRTNIIEPTGSRKRGLFTKQDREQKQVDDLLAKSLADRMSIGRPRSQTLWPNIDINIPAIREAIAWSVPPLVLITGDILGPSFHSALAELHLCKTRFWSVQSFCHYEITNFEAQCGLFLLISVTRGQCNNWYLNWDFFFTFGCETIKHQIHTISVE